MTVGPIDETSRIRETPLEQREIEIASIRRGARALEAGRSIISSDPETQAVVTVILSIAVPVRRAEIVGWVEPGPTADHSTIAAAIFDPGATVGWRTDVVIVPTVGHPFPHVTVHIVETEIIGTL